MRRYDFVFGLRSNTAKRFQRAEILNSHMLLLQRPSRLNGIEVGWVVPRGQHADAMLLASKFDASGMVGSHYCARRHRRFSIGEFVYL
jgi:hypothetical protein